MRNCCLSDDPDHLPYVKVGTINFHNSGHHLDHYQSLRGTSKVRNFAVSVAYDHSFHCTVQVEAVHSVLDRTFYSQRGICAEVFDARLGWWVTG